MIFGHFGCQGALAAKRALLPLTLRQGAKSVKSTDLQNLGWSFLVEDLQEAGRIRIKNHKNMKQSFC